MGVAPDARQTARTPFWLRTATAVRQVACGQKIKWFKTKYLNRVFGSWDPSYYHKSTQTYKGGWKLILPAFAIGVPLYYLKRK